MKRTSVLPAYGFLPALLLFLMPVAAEPLYGQDKPFILILHAYHQGYAWTDSIDVTLRKVLSEESSLEIATEYMDTKRNDYASIKGTYRDYLYFKYRTRSRKPALIICSDDDALNFLIEYRQDIFPGSPVVFCGVNDFTPERIAGFNNCTGINEAPDFKGTLKTALTLFPMAPAVIAITDTTTTGQANKNRFNQAVRELSPDRAIILVEDWTEQELAALLQENKTALVLLLHVNLRERTGVIHTTDDTAGIINKYTAAPIFTCWEYVLGLGILGGRMISGYTQGEMAGKMALRILSGEKADSLPVVMTSPNRFVFDYREMKQHHLAEEQLPSGSMILGRPYSFYQTYRNIIWISAGIFLALVAIVVFLILYTLLKRKSVKDLEESRSRLELALKGGDLGLWDWSVQTGQAFFSEGYLAMLGFARDEIPASFDTWKNLLHPDDREKTLTILGQHITGKADTYEAEFRLRTKRGGWKWILARGKVMEREPKTSRALRACGTHMDITERKYQELELTEKNNLLQAQYAQIKDLNERLVVVTRQAQEADQLKSAFLSNVSHEVRTPLNGIIGFSELLEDPSIPEKEKIEYISIIRSSGEHLLSLINDIILISKSDAGQIEIRRKDFNPSDIVRELSDFFQANTQLKEKKINLVSELPDKEFNLNSDPDRIRQIISNLITNAIKNTDNGQIRISLQKVDGKIVFKVSDTGRGIPEEFRERIFERFYQISGQTTAPVEGTGLGLSICKALSEHLGGSIRLESETGRGTTFFFTLPE
jgi:PAS domain S-box-containing protein